MDNKTTFYSQGASLVQNVKFVCYPPSCTSVMSSIGTGCDYLLRSMLTMACSCVLV